MSEQITSHLVVNGNDSLTIEVNDERGPANANHSYSISGFYGENNPTYTGEHGSPSYSSEIMFQHGPIQNGQMNGVTIESLLAICKHRLEGFQAGQFACSENQTALDSIVHALETLKYRTAKRIAQNVEGKMINHESLIPESSVKFNLATFMFPELKVANAEEHLRIMNSFQVPIGTPYDPELHIEINRNGSVVLELKGCEEARRKHLESLGITNAVFQQ